MAANPSHACASVIVDELVRLGLRHACIAPGSRSAALVMALDDHEGVALHVGIDERSVAFLALGIARGTGDPVAVVTTSGTAAVNLHPAVVEADASRVPLLMLTADRPPELRHTGANQTIDQVGLFGSAIRWALDLGVPEDRATSNAYWRSTVDRAWAHATGSAASPPGPVHLNLPMREPLVPRSDDGRTAAAPFASTLDGRGDGDPWTRLEPGGRGAGPGVVDRLVERIGANERGLLVVGDTDTAPGPIVALAEAAGWPLLAEPLSGARTGPNAVSTYDHLLAYAPFADDHRPDLVIRIGRVALSRNLLAWLGPDVPQVLIDRDGVWLDPSRAVGDLIASDPAATCEAVAGLLDGGTTAWLEGWQRAESAARQAVDRRLDADHAPSEPRTARDAATAIPDGGWMVAASSMPVRDLDRAMHPRTGLRVVGNRGASGIDGFVSTALGVAIAADGPVVALAGDLSLLHDSNGFLLLDEQVDLTLVVVNNDGGGIFHHLPQAGFDSFERLFGTPHGRDLEKLAAFHSLWYERIDRAADLAPAIRASTEDGGIRMIEVRTDRRAQVDLHRELRAAVADALRAP